MVKNAEILDDLIKKAKILLQKDRGIVLLEHLNPNKRKYIHEQIDEMSDIDSFSIGHCSTRRVVLRYNKEDNNINVKELIKLGNESYKNKDYKKCIYTLKTLLANGVNEGFIYAKIGLSYMKLDNKKLALDYLIVANELNMLSHRNHNNLDSLIEKLSKESIKIEENSTFYGHSLTDDNYGIENINDILHLIIDEKNDINEVALKFNLSDIELNIIKLFVAKEYYTDCFFDIGDRYLKEVEKSKTKNKVINKLINEIRENKIFYKNRNKKREYKKTGEN